LLNALDSNAKKFEMEISEKKKEYQALEYEKDKIVRDYNDKISDLRTKGFEVQNLIEKVRKTGNTDKDLEQILSKWED